MFQVIASYIPLLKCRVLGHQDCSSALGGRSSGPEGRRRSRPGGRTCSGSRRVSSAWRRTAPRSASAGGPLRLALREDLVKRRDPSSTGYPLGRRCGSWALHRLCLVRVADSCAFLTRFCPCESTPGRAEVIAAAVERGEDLSIGGKRAAGRSWREDQDLLLLRHVHALGSALPVF